MDSARYISQLQQQNDSKILLVVADGLGGLPDKNRGTELEEARTPHLDRLAREGVTGMLLPASPGITCGSGPGHLALFGLDPFENDIGRGVLTALGIGFDLQRGDVAARGNFCTVDEKGDVVDRRAGRISSEEGSRLVRKLQRIKLETVAVFVEAVKQHRFLLALRGENLDPRIEDTDPQQTGTPPNQPSPRDHAAKRTSELVAAFVDKARNVLKDEEPANMVLLRGFETRPELASMEERYGVRACAVAGYPMYRGIASLLGMKAVKSDPDLSREIDALRSEWDDHDFFFLHYKATDSAGEDGDFDAKVRAIEELDHHVPSLLDLHPDVLIVTGDHSTPTQFGSHSWHPVPVVLSASTCRRDGVESFGETACMSGGLSLTLTKRLMPLALAHAGRLRKFGA